MALAVLTAQRTTCLRRGVGCVLLNARGHVLATGYNGVAAGRPHCNLETERQVNPARIREDGSVRVAEHWEYPTLPVYGHACSGAHAPSGQQLDACQAIHAEQNALLQCKDVYQLHQAFVTASPCMTCTKLLLNTSCQEIYYLTPYAHQDAAELWTGAGRRWTQLDTPYLRRLTGAVAP